MLDSHRFLRSGRVPARCTSVGISLEERRVIDPKVKNQLSLPKHPILASYSLETRLGRFQENHSSIVLTHLCVV